MMSRSEFTRAVIDYGGLTFVDGDEEAGLEKLRELQAHDAALRTPEGGRLCDCGSNNLEPGALCPCHGMRSGLRRWWARRPRMRPIPPARGGRE